VRAITSCKTTNFATDFLLRFNLVPTDAKEPDIVINACSSNDITRYRRGGRDSSLETAQRFVRHYLSPGSPVSSTCRSIGDNHANESSTTATPLIIFLDDLLGNSPRHILRSMGYGELLGTVTEYYGVGRVSFPDMVRDLVYGDTTEYWFTSVDWWGADRDKPKREMKKQIHPDLGMHTATSWAFAYYFAAVVVDYCSLEPNWELVPREPYGVSEMAKWATSRNS